VKFNFNYGIKAVFAIAPVDGQYKPAGVFTPLENVNYMVIHGSHDGDVSSFNGLRLYQRLQTLLTDELPYVPLYVRVQWMVARPEVKGIRLDPGGRHRLERMMFEPPPAPPPRAPLNPLSGLPPTRP